MTCRATDAVTAVSSTPTEPTSSRCSRYASPYRLYNAMCVRETKRPLTRGRTSAKSLRTVYMTRLAKERRARLARKRLMAAARVARAVSAVDGGGMTAPPLDAAAVAAAAAAAAAGVRLPPEAPVTVKALRSPLTLLPGVPRC
eukprot:TRINITY_DN3124_c1_g1_i1.p2 TRINITY_DN3124_c1_g1~~TRINITY_DN3124_c1_g1_i1.p2  ORF type:complete len:160 (-),score=43.43 TRINITY_DN3124_c1_g1_i1:416-844(-)